MRERLSEITNSDVSRETCDQLEAYVSILIAASAHQNLISASTVDSVWDRHILDSAQLVLHGRPGTWLDIGSGAGLPGMVIAILTRKPTTLVEPRRLRAQFLVDTAAALSLTHVTVIQAKPPAIWGNFENITARAVATTDALFAMAAHLSHSDTHWLLPKGRGAKKELDEVREAWHGAFRLEPSITDPEASIIVASAVRAKKRGTR